MPQESHNTEKLLVSPRNLGLVGCIDGAHDLDYDVLRCTRQSLQQVVAKCYGYALHLCQHCHWRRCFLRACTEHSAELIYLCLHIAAWT